MHTFLTTFGLVFSLVRPAPLRFRPPPPSPFVASPPLARLFSVASAPVCDSTTPLSDIRGVMSLQERERGERRSQCSRRARACRRGCAAEELARRTTAARMESTGGFFLAVLPTGLGANDVVSALGDGPPSATMRRLPGLSVYFAMLAHMYKTNYPIPLVHCDPHLPPRRFSTSSPTAPTSTTSWHWPTRPWRTRTATTSPTPPPSPAP